MGSSPCSAPVFGKQGPQRIQQIMREHPGFPVQSGGTVGSCTVEINGTGGGLKSRQTAGQQGAGHARQHIPAAAPGKPRVAGGITEKYLD